MSHEFEASLKHHVETDPSVTDDQKDRILHVLSMPTRGFLGARRKNILARMERRARMEVGASDKEAIDWSKIDWAALIAFFLKILALFGV